MHQILQILAFISTFKSRDNPLLECRWSFSRTSCLSHLKTSDAFALERKEDPPGLARICITSIRFFIVLFVVSWLKVVISQSLTEPVANQFTAVSSRMEQLYEKEVRKARRRPKTDQQERRPRDRLWEERELHECTFHPKLKWGSKKSSKKSSLPVPNQVAASTLTPPAKLKQSRFPKEIIVIPPPPNDTKHRPWHTPRRQEKLSEFMMVSPLRDPSVVDEDESSRWIKPRINTGSVVASGSIAVTQAGTEYGSI